MTRPIVLSNGSMHVGVNLFGMVHDFYYPYVGMENHATANNMRHRVGVWTENHFSWLDDGSWEFDIDYEPEALIGMVRAHNSELGITLELQDTVDSDQNVYLRNIHLVNQFSRDRTIKLFLHQVFRISNSLNGETAQYLPDHQAILHYKGRRAFLIGAQNAARQAFDQFSIGIYGIEGKEGTYRDAEDGKLSGNVVEHGSVDSVIGFDLKMGAHDSTRVSYWIAAGRELVEVTKIHCRLKKEGIYPRFEATQAYWRRWLQPAEKVIAQIDKNSQEAFRKSLLIAKSHIDDHGAVIASTDTTIRNYSRDAYGYCWPRDAAYGLWPLLRLGYYDELKNYFAFCKRVVHPDGYLMHKYQADGALGSSWHPYLTEGRVTPPIQEDETASMVFLFGQYYELTKDDTLLHTYYDTLIQPAANFMAEHIDEVTRLPHATYDLWEEIFMTTTYTTATVYAALLSAAQLAEGVGNEEDAVRWQATADDMRHAAHQLLYNPDKHFFYRGFVRRGADLHSLAYDDTIDMSSFYGAFMYGLFDLHGEQVTQSAETIRKRFGIKEQGVTPIPRYEHDDYYIADATSLGNPWFITTMWYAQYLMEIGQLEPARQIVQWVQSQMLQSGVLAEQIDPRTLKFVGVAPLLWSQAEFLNSIMDLTSDPNTGEVKTA